MLLYLNLMFCSQLPLQSRHGLLYAVQRAKVIGDHGDILTNGKAGHVFKPLLALSSELQDTALTIIGNKNYSIIGNMNRINRNRIVLIRNLIGLTVNRLDVSFCQSS